MNYLTSVLIMSMLFIPVHSSIAAQSNKTIPLAAVDSVDLNRYMGTWYEIARLPNWFQKKCTGEVTATYTLQDDGTILVVNRCRKEGGKYAEAEGIAKPAQTTGPNTKLKVRFAPGFLSFLPFVWGDYWIIDLAHDYSYAVIGEPNRKYLWILSRTPTMDETTFQSVLDRVHEQGYDTANIIKTRQSEHSTG